MGAATVDGPNGEFIQSTGAMFARFSAELLPQLGEWEGRLLEDPGGLETVERDVQQAFLRGAGLMIAGLVSVTMQSPALLDAAEQTRQDFNQPLSKGRERRISVNVLGGVMMWVTSLYCQARRTPSESADGKGFGVYTELVQFGFGKKVSPALESDGTFAGPDATAELVAMHLHRLGAAKAESVTFVSDGAVWIWDRMDSIVEQAGIPDTVPIHQVLDNCHAAHHVSLALATLGVEQDVRMPLYRDMRTRLRNGRWRSVVDELQALADEDPTNTQLRTEIGYLRRHGEAGRLAYTTFDGLGIPLGSEAIESSIRRVINLRLKGNAIFWKELAAESMLQLRALVISNRWDARLTEMRSYKRRIHRSDWHWIPQSMTNKSEGAATQPQTSV